MNKGAHPNKLLGSNKTLEETLSGIPAADIATVQSVVERMIKDAREEVLVEAEELHQALREKALAEAGQLHQAFHEKALAEALAEAEERHQTLREKALAEAEERHQAEIQALHEELALERQRLYGRKSESRPHQPEVFDEAETTAEGSTEADDQAGIPPAESAKEPANGKASAKPRGKRAPIPPHIERRDVIIDLPEDQRICPCCNEIMAEIGEDVSEQIDIIPMQFLVTRTHRKRYACGHREHKPMMAPRPPQVLPKSNATNAFLAMLMTMKYLDGLPLARIEYILERIGLRVPRVTQARWLIQSAEHLKPLAEAMNQVLLGSDLILMDETTVQVLKEKGRDPSTKSYMWVRRGGPKDKTVVLYTYEPSRSGDIPVQLLKGWKGYLMTDGYAGYHQVGRNEGVELLACWAHARRYFVDVIKLQPKHKRGRADDMVAMIAELYAVEKEVRKAEDAERYHARLTKSKPILDRIKLWLDREVDGTPPKGALGVAIAYALKYWPRLIRYIERGDLPIDNNPCEGSIRPFVRGRRAWLFSDTPAGANASAMIYSMVETAKANGHEPHSWLNHVMRELPKAREMKSYDHLLPWNLNAADLIRDAYLREAPSS